MKKLMLLLLTFMVTQLLFAQTIHYVKKGGTGDGSSWNNASGDLQAIISAAQSGNQVWVAKGTYYPDEGGGNADNDRTASFTMKNGVAIYGGFAGTETNLSDRDWKTNATILSGDIDQNDGANFSNNSGNSYHVVNNDRLNNTAVLDGFTITAGNNGDNGGGMINAGSSPTLTNCSFLANSASQGGGMYNRNCSPILNNCSFAGNRASSSGGGMFNFISSSPSLTNCSFSRNTAFANNGGGGGMCSSADGSSPRLTNCSFFANSAPNGTGGGIFIDVSSVTLVNCTFSGNSAAHAGAVVTDIYSSGTLTNCILWGNPGGTTGETYLGGDVTVNNCIIQGFDSQDPRFVDAANGNLRLRPCSPAINAGLNSANSTTKDLDGNTRIYNGTIDLGAYEDQDVFISNVLYVNAAAPTSSGDGLSWATAFKSLQEALANACSGGVKEIWVAKGTYYPDEGGGKADNDRTASFALRNGLAIYGGFAGTETSLAERDWKTNVTILSGDIDQNDGADFTNNSGNSYHVVFTNPSVSLNNTAVLDGFTITAGNANGSSDQQLGGGMCNLVGGPSVTNCIFSRNRANSGGGVYIRRPGPRLTNCVFWANSANDGGGLYSRQTRLRITNCSFSANSAINGGGLYNTEEESDSNPTLTNCILWGNTGGEIYNVSGSATVTYSIVQGGYSGTGNKDQDPLFVDAANGNLRLQTNSPAINAGLNSANSTTRDLDGNPRIAGCTIDMGAYEDQTGTIVIATQPAAAQSVCQNTPATALSVTATGDNPQYQWFSSANNSNSNGTAISGATTSSYTPSTSSAGTTYYYVVVSGSCNSVASEVAAVTIKPLPALTSTLTPGAICSNTTFNYNPAGSLTNTSFSWNRDVVSGIFNTAGSGVGSISETLQNTTTAPVNVTYVYTLTNSNGCSNAAPYNVVVTVNPLPTVTIADAKALSTGVDVNTVYVGYAPASSLTLQANAGGGSGPFTYQWSTGATTPSITVSPAATTTYTVTVSKGACTAMASKQVKVVDVRCGNKMDKVSVCHGGNTHCIDKTSVQDHLNHGDYLGSCTTSGRNLKPADEQAAAPLSITTAPNPSRSYFSLTVHSTDLKGRVTLLVIDAVGRTVETKTAIAGQTLQIGDQYSAGVYFVQAVQGSSSVTVKLVKQ